jgi:hypothetical protein
VSAEAARPTLVEAQTVVVVAEEERPRQELIAFEPAMHHEPVLQDVTPTPQPEGTSEELARPAPEPRDLEPTDK